MQPSSSPRSTVVLGGGPSGLACARRLSAAGERVVVLDKGRRPSGRLSTRRPRAFPHLALDVGAQFFTARDDDFLQQVDAWRRRSLVAEWSPRRSARLDDPAGPGRTPAARWVGVPDMGTLVADLCNGLDVRFSTKVWRLRRAETAGREARHPAAGRTPDPRTAARRPSTRCPRARRPRAWHLDVGPDVRGASIDEVEIETWPEAFDRVVVATPAPQARPLLEGHPFADRLRGVELAPCWATMLIFDRPAEVVDAATGEPIDLIEADDGPLAWAADNASKPGRNPTSAWTLHAGPDWSLQHLDAEPAWIVETMLNAFRQRVRWPADAQIVDRRAHRWRFARVTTAAGAPFLWDAEAGLGVAGDGCLAPRVEAAWISGHRLAEAMLAEAMLDTPDPS
ncbi:MAG: NAD(P)-binding protein [Acidobacteriota bacterium]